MPTLIDIKVPDEQSEGTTSTLSAWLVQPGASVKAYAPVAELETDKVMVEIAAPADGVLREQLKQVGDAIEPGEVIARLEEGATTAPVTAADTGGADSVRPAKRNVARGGDAKGRLSPAVRRLLQQYDLDASKIAGTGRDGRITADDVTAFREARKQQAAAGGLTGRMVPHDAMRRRIAGHMVESLLHTAPHVTSVFEADLSAALAHRETHKEDFAARGARLTVTAYVVAATVRALQAVPEVNSRWHADALEIFDDINVGVGTALGTQGLIVPVIRRAQDLDLFGIAERLDDLITRARAGGLDPSEVRDGSFTISNHGVGGSLLATPIVINQPQTAILGLGKLEKRAVVVEDDRGADSIVIRPMAYVTLSIDHRALDAFQTNAFLTALVDALQDW